MLSAPSAFTVTVAYATSNGTATAGSDYLAQAGTLVFAPNQTSKTIAVPIVDDLSDEPNETFSVTRNSPNNANPGTPSSTTVTITDDDPAPTVAWENPNGTVGEGIGTALVAVNLSAASAVTVTVVYSTTNGSALAGSDYTGACLRRVDNPDPCLLLIAAQRHVRPAIGLGSHQNGVRRGAAPRGGVGGWPSTARRAGDQLPNR